MFSRHTHPDRSNASQLGRLTLSGPSPASRAQANRLSFALLDGKPVYEVDLVTEEAAQLAITTMFGLYV